MNRAQKILQAYRNTPWRRQTQILGLFAAFGVVAALVMIVYIWVTSQAGAYGLQVQEAQATQQALAQSIEDKQARLADITRNEVLATRAAEAGYEPVDPNRVRYLEVEGYYGQPPLQLAPPPEAIHQYSPDPGLPPEYTTSLFDWFSELIYQLSQKTGAAEAGE